MKNNVIKKNCLILIMIKKKSYSSDVYFMGLLIFFIIKSEPDEFSKVDPLIYE